MASFDELHEALNEICYYTENDKLPGINDQVKELFQNDNDKFNFSNFINNNNFNRSQLYYLAKSLVQNDFKELTQQLLERVVNKKYDKLDNDDINLIIVMAIEEALVKDWPYDHISDIKPNPTPRFFDEHLAQRIDINRDYSSQALINLSRFVADHFGLPQQKVELAAIKQFIGEKLPYIASRLESSAPDYEQLYRILPTEAIDPISDNYVINLAFARNKDFFVNYIINGIEYGPTTFMNKLLKDKSTAFSSDQRSKILQATANKLKSDSEEDHLNLILDNYNNCPLNPDALIELYFQDPSSDSLKRLSDALQKQDEITGQDQQLKNAFSRFNPKTQATIAYRIAISVLEDKNNRLQAIKNVITNDNRRRLLALPALAYALQGDTPADIKQIDNLFNQLEVENKDISIDLERLSHQLDAKSISDSNLSNYIQLVKDKYEKPHDLFESLCSELIYHYGSSNEREITRLVDEYELFFNKSQEKSNENTQRQLAKSCKKNQEFIVNYLINKIKNGSNDVAQKAAQAVESIYRFVDKNHFEQLYDTLKSNNSPHLNNLVYEALFNTPAECYDTDEPRPLPKWDTKGLLEFFNDNPNKLKGLLNHTPSTNYKVTPTTVKRAFIWELPQLTTQILDYANTNDILNILLSKIHPRGKTLMYEEAYEYFAHKPQQLDKLLQSQQADQVFEVVYESILTNQKQGDAISITAAKLLDYTSSDYIEKNGNYSPNVSTNQPF